MKVKDRPNLRGGCWYNSAAGDIIVIYSPKGIAPEYREPYGGFRTFRRGREPLGKQ